MPIAASLLVLTLLGADGSPGPGPDPAPLDYQIRILDMKGLDWRGTAHDQLSPVARQGNATVWTAGRGLAAELAKVAEGVATAPRIRALPGAVAEVRDEVRQGIVADLTRVADGPVGQATAVAFQPQIDQVHLGFRAKLACRTLDQGMLIKVQLEDVRLSAIHTATLHEDLKTKDVTGLNARYQVPEVVRSSAQGEWLIPGDGALVVSFGPDTRADAQGRAVVHERVVLIEARPANLAREESPTTQPAKPSIDPHATTAVYLSTEPVATPRPAQSPARRQVMVASPLPFPVLGTLPAWFFLPIHLPAASSEPAPIGQAAPATDEPTLPTPAPPSRILPTPRAADGTVTELPPLPDNETHPASLDQSDEPRPSPQSPARTTPRSGSKATKATDHGEAGQPAAPMSKTTDPEANPASAALSSRVKASGAAGPVVLKAEPLDETDCQYIATVRDSLVEVNRLIKMLTDRNASGIKESGSCTLGHMYVVSEPDCMVKKASQESEANEPTTQANNRPVDRQGTCPLTVPMELGSVPNTPLTFRIPLGGSEVVEIRATVTRLAAEPSECCEDCK